MATAASIGAHKKVTIADARGADHYLAWVGCLLKYCL
jgi:hypothetical protein